jgi:hypothetical protein
MKVRSLAGALLIGSAVALGPALAVPASAAPCPPTDCTGQTGILNASLTLTRVGGSVHFFGCGFIPGRSVVITINGTVVRAVLTQGDGSIDFTWTFTFQQAGAARVQVAGPARFPDRRTTAASLRSGESVRTIAAADPTRVLSTTVRVLPAGITGTNSGTGVGTGGLPVTGVEAGALGALAIALTGGGIGLRTLSRRREAALAGDSSEE